MLELNDELAVINKVRSPFKSSFIFYINDIDFKGEDELLLYSDGEEKLVILDAELKRLLMPDLKEMESYSGFLIIRPGTMKTKHFLMPGIMVTF